MFGIWYPVVIWYLSDIIDQFCVSGGCVVCLFRNQRIFEKVIDELLRTLVPYDALPQPVAISINSLSGDTICPSKEHTSYPCAFRLVNVAIPCVIALHIYSSDLALYGCLFPWIFSFSSCNGEFRQCLFYAPMWYIHMCVRLFRCLMSPIENPKQRNLVITFSIPLFIISLPFQFVVPFTSYAY